MKQTLKSRAISYDLMEHLGEGLNSVVYKAVRADSLNHLNQTVALKILKSKNLVEIWKREFASLQQVVCKHCIRVYGFEWIDDRPALVLEYVNGISLRQLCLAGPISKELSHEILAQIQTGLLSLKEQGLSHGDLSPNNVMIDESGLVRLLDFGWANATEERVQTTQAFAAPEILSGGRPSFESDLYSLGAIEKMMTRKTSSRLSLRAEDRSPFDGKSTEKGQKKLAAKVRHVQDYQNRFLQMMTKSLVVTKNVRSPLIHAFTLLFVIILSPQSQRWTSSVHDFGILKVRAEQWMKIKINGQEVGFAPQELLLKPNRSHSLEWQAQNKSGKMAIHVQQDQIKVINKDDLHP